AAALFLTTRLNFMTSDSTRTHQRRAAFVWALCAACALIATHSISRAQERPSGADPRVGLKAGLRDAGVAARGMELVANLPKPQGFFDPKAPGGDPTPAETDDNRGPGRGATAAGGATAGAATPENPPAAAAGAQPVAAGGGGRGPGLNFANSDL